MTTPQCSVHGLACSTAYNSRKCKCDDCLNWREGRNPYVRWKVWCKAGGIATQEEYAAALSKTHCDCCGVKLTSQKGQLNSLVVDHDHAITDGNNIRGTLCLACNTAEGYLTSAERCRLLADYLDR